MNVEETKRLFRTYRITPNKFLGQNFMVEPRLYPKLADIASLGNLDVVLDVGAGFGFLSLFLADKCKAVVAVEKDRQVVRVLCDQVKGIDNIIVIVGDVLAIALPEFNKVIAIPPYYMSSRLITWFFKQKIDCAVLILQKEFARRLIAPVGSEDYGWLTVLTYHWSKVDLLDIVPKSMFYPQPEVDSVIVRLIPWSTVPFEVKNPAFYTQMVKWLFTQRNKKLSKAIIPFIKKKLKLTEQDSERLTSNVSFKEKRTRELLPEEFGELANELQK